MIDILLNQDFEPSIAGGDFQLGESKSQNVAILLECNPGEIRQHPEMGIGLRRYLNGGNTGELSRQFTRQVVSIEQTPASLTVTQSGEVQIVL